MFFAYERGNYQTAFGEFQLLAKRGDANAQFNIGQTPQGTWRSSGLADCDKWYTSLRNKEMPVRLTI